MRKKSWLERRTHTARIEIRCQDDKSECSPSAPHYVRLVAGNGEPQMHSEMYPTLNGAERAVVDWARSALQVLISTGYVTPAGLTDLAIDSLEGGDHFAESTK